MKKTYLPIFIYFLFSTLLFAQEIQKPIEQNDGNNTKKEKQGIATVGDKILFKDGPTILMELENEGSTGSIFIPNAGIINPSPSANKLYNKNGNLFWGNSQIDAVISSGGWTRSGANIYPTTLTDKVGIGTASPFSLLSVGGDGASNAAIFGNATSGLYYGGYFKSDHNSGRGVRGEATNNQGVGVQGTAAGTNGWGVYGYATGSSGRGIYGYASENSAYAGYFSGRVFINSQLGIGTDSPETMLHVNTNTQFDPGNYGDGRKGSLFLTLSGGTQSILGIGPALIFGGINTFRRRAAITAYQTTSDPDQVGLAFYTHPGTSASNDEVIQQMVITHGGNVGVGTKTPDTKLDVNGGLKVTGAYTGNIGPNNGAPFPRPAYDSGRRAISPGQTITLTHSIGGDPDNYFVDLWFYGSSGRNISDLGGDDDDFDDFGGQRGGDWSNLTASQIKIYRGDSSSDNQEFRVRIWVYN